MEHRVRSENLESRIEEGHPGVRECWNDRMLDQKEKYLHSSSLSHYSDIPFFQYSVALCSLPNGFWLLAANSSLFSLCGYFLSH